MATNGGLHRGSVKDRIGPNQPRFAPIVTQSDPVRRRLFTPTVTLEQDLGRRRMDQRTLNRENEDTGSSQPDQRDQIRLQKIMEAETELELLRRRQQEWDAHLSELRKQGETIATVVGGEREMTPHSRLRTVHQDDIRRPSRSERHSEDIRQPGSPDRHYRRRTRSPINRRDPVAREEQQGIPQMIISEAIMQRLANVEQQLEATQTEPRMVDPKSPFSPTITQKRVDPKKKLPPLEMYDGTGDPYDHTHSYQSVMDYYNHSEVGMCRIFVTTLKKLAK